MDTFRTGHVASRTPTTDCTKNNSDSEDGSETYTQNIEDMRRRLYVTLLCAMQMLFAVAQDEQRSIEVVVNDSQPVEIDFEACRLAVSAIESGDSEVSLSIDLKNNTSNYIFLFERDYTKKDLRKEKIRFDKKSYGSTSRRTLACEGVNDDEMLRIAPSGNSILTIDGITNDVKRCELPLYIARSKKICKKKFVIMRRVKVILNVTIIPETVIDDKYEGISQRCAILIDDISNTSICTRPTHPISVDRQKMDFVSRIVAIKEQISEVKSAHRWDERDEEYQKYKELIVQLDNIEFNEAYCGQCGQTRDPHKCKYCNMPSGKVVDEAQRIFTNLDNGDITKSDAIKNIEQLRKAWTGGCPKLKQRVNSDSSIRNNLNRYYEDIKNF